MSEALQKTIIVDVVAAWLWVAILVILVVTAIPTAVVVTCDPSAHESDQSIRIVCTDPGPSQRNSGQ